MKQRSRERRENMSDRQDSCHRPRAEDHVTTAVALGPRRSDLSSGGGQVRQSNRSGLSKKPGAGDSSRQDESSEEDGRSEGRTETQIEKSTGRGTGGKSQRTPSADNGGGDSAGHAEQKR
jgi:hypothetical protein